MQQLIHFLTSSKKAYLCLALPMGEPLWRDKLLDLHVPLRGPQILTCRGYARQLREVWGVPKVRVLSQRNGDTYFLFTGPKNRFPNFWDIKLSLRVQRRKENKNRNLELVILLFFDIFLLTLTERELI